MDESLNELKQADEAGKKAMSDAARLAEELRQEQEHSNHVDRMRKGLEDSIREMQIRLEEAEQAALKGGKKIIAKLEQRVSTVFLYFVQSSERCSISSAYFWRFRSGNWNRSLMLNKDAIRKATRASAKRTEESKSWNSR